jgi:hypothetical protein
MQLKSEPSCVVPPVDTPHDAGIEDDEREKSQDYTGQRCDQSQTDPAPNEHYSREEVAPNHDAFPFFVFFTLFSSSMRRSVRSFNPGTMKSPFGMLSIP